ncbi:hypothetical protein [Halothece sp. PCC 7418]|uniref:hypothetical protein n=1 Tax=Halothece sp. (strain PCC 7418) TaxID=65093 RepID=UPI001F16EC52|nr:hypothetical protein [Halothece sp. PCC 7418]
MNAHKVSLTLTTDGEVTLKGLPFQAGETVEVIVLEKSARSRLFLFDFRSRLFKRS